MYYAACRQDLLSSRGVNLPLRKRQKISYQNWENDVAEKAREDDLDEFDQQVVSRQVSTFDSATHKLIVPRTKYREKCRRQYNDEECFSCNKKQYKIKKQRNVQTMAIRLYY